MSLVSCNECGGTVSTRAVACPHCGAPQEGARHASAGRFESRIVNVEPKAVNDCIRLMEHFGYILQASQEVVGEVHEAPWDGGLFASVFRGTAEGWTGRKTYVQDNHVRLHFVRDLSLPNLEELRELEQETFPP